MSLPTVAGAAGGLGLSRRCVHADVWRWCHTHSMSISYTPGQSRAQADVFRECGGSSDTLYLISRRLSVIIVRWCPLQACLGRIFDQMINSKRACETDLRHITSLTREFGKFKSFPIISGQLTRGIIEKQWRVDEFVKKWYERDIGYSILVVPTTTNIYRRHTLNKFSISSASVWFTVQTSVRKPDRVSTNVINFCHNLYTLCHSIAILRMCRYEWEINNGVEFRIKNINASLGEK